MTMPTEMIVESEAISPLAGPGAVVDVFVEAQAAEDTYHLIAARRAQLEDAETLRRMRAL